VFICFLDSFVAMLMEDSTRQAVKCREDGWQLSSQDFSLQPDGCFEAWLCHCLHHGCFQNFPEIIDFG
jgi:hypothetical protein